MAILDGPRCPGCQGAVSLRELWKEAPKVKGLFLEGKVGIVCPSCGNKLRVLQYRVVIVTLGLFAAVCVTAAILGNIERARDFRPPQGVQYLIIGLMVGGMFFFQSHYAYRFATLRRVRDGEK